MFFKISFLERPVLEGVFYNAGLCKIFYKTPQDDFFENIEMNFFFFFFFDIICFRILSFSKKKKRKKQQQVIQKFRASIVFTEIFVKSHGHLVCCLS